MAYFPFFIDLSGKKCLIVGGGNVAARKLEKIRDFGAKIIVVAPEICSAITESGVTIIKRRFEDSDINGAFLVIAATDDRELNHHIYSLCTSYSILVNTVDDIENCGFIFPAIVHKNNITVGISTGGECPAMAGEIRKAVDGMINERFLAAADILSRFRPKIKEMFDTENIRSTAMKSLLEICMKADVQPDDKKISELLEAIKDGNKNRNT